VAAGRPGLRSAARAPGRSRLADIWTLATGRTLRCDVPPHELTTEELISFWSDDHLDAEAAASPIRHD
jgi:hypothetical protein